MGPLTNLDHSNPEWTSLQFFFGLLPMGQVHEGTSCNDSSHNTNFFLSAKCTVIIKLLAIYNMLFRKFHFCSIYCGCRHHIHDINYWVLSYGLTHLQFPHISGGCNHILLKSLTVPIRIPGVRQILAVRAVQGRILWNILIGIDLYTGNDTRDDNACIL